MDPISIIGTAVGIVSLGIQVSGGLISYVSDLKNERHEVATICNQIDELGRILEDLEKIVKPVNNDISTVDASFTRTTQTCSYALVNIRNRLLPFSSTSNQADSSLREGLRKIAHRLTYPFRRSDMLFIKDVAQMIQMNLNTALAALTVKQNILQQENSRQLVAMSQTTAEKMVDIGESVSQIQSALSTLCSAMPSLAMFPQVLDGMVMGPNLGPAHKQSLPTFAIENGSSNPTNALDFLGSAVSSEVEQWQYLLRPDKTATDQFSRLLTGIAKYIDAAFKPLDCASPDCPDLTPAQLSSFYRAVGGNYDILFVDTPPASLSFVYKTLGCAHSLQPEANHDYYQQPKIPALKMEGFITWQVVQLLLGPEEHSAFLKRAVSDFPIIDPKTGRPFPHPLPAEVFPERPDPELLNWYEEAAEKLKKEAENAIEIKEEVRKRTSDTGPTEDREMEEVSGDEEMDEETTTAMRLYFVPNEAWALSPAL